MCDNKKPIHLS